MKATSPNARFGFQLFPDDAVKETLDRLDELLSATPDYAQDASFFAALGGAFRQLHARIRAHHAADYLGSPHPGVAVPAEWAHDWTRLRDEHPRILGQLDWLIRRDEAIADQPVEDRDVFLLRVRELIAVLRRHEAEEDRLFALALWHDTGGES